MSKPSHGRASPRAGRATLLAALAAFACVALAPVRRASGADGVKVTPAAAVAVPPPAAALAGPPLAFWAVRALGVPDAEVREIESALDAAAQRLAVVGHFVVLGREEVARRLAAPSAAALAACDGSDECVGQIAALCGASGAVGGQIGGLGGTYSVNLTLVSPTGGAIRRSDGVLERGPALGLAAEEIIARLIAPELHRGFLDLSVDVDGARLYVDGAEAGTSPLSGAL